MNAIRWCDVTNPVGIRGCSAISPGCAHCYAAAMAYRLGAMSSPPLGYLPEMTYIGRDGVARWTGVVHADAELLRHDLARLPKRKPTLVFPSMVDPFHGAIPVDHLDDALYEFAQRPHLRLQLLTKRAHRLLGYANRRRAPLPPGTWIGVTCEDQKRANERIPLLLRAAEILRPAVTFLSVEPLLERVNLRLCDEFPVDGGCYEDARHHIGLVIVGGESGPRARPCDVDWIVDVVWQCKNAGVPVMVKQLSPPIGADVARWPTDLRPYYDRPKEVFGE